MARGLGSVGWLTLVGLLASLYLQPEVPGARSAPREQCGVRGRGSDGQGRCAGSIHSPPGAAVGDLSISGQCKPGHRGSVRKNSVTPRVTFT